MASQRVEGLRSGYEAFNRGEVDGLLENAAPDFMARDIAAPREQDLVATCVTQRTE